MRIDFVKDFNQMLSMFLEPLHFRDRLKAGMTCRALREASRNIRIYVDDDIEMAIEKAQSLETLVLRPGIHIIRKPLSIIKRINIEGLSYARSKRDLCALRGTSGLLRCREDSEYREYALRDFSQWVALYVVFSLLSFKYEYESPASRSNHTRSNTGTVEEYQEDLFI